MENSQVSEPSRAARDALTAALDNLDLRIRRPAEQYRPETLRKYRAAVRDYYSWCQRNGRQMEITAPGVLDYITELRATEAVRAQTLYQRVSALQYYAARLPGELISLEESRRLTALTVEAARADGVPPLYRVPKRRPTSRRRG